LGEIVLGSPQIFERQMEAVEETSHFQFVSLHAPPAIRGDRDACRSARTTAFRRLPTGAVINGEIQTLKFSPAP